MARKRTFFIWLLYALLTGLFLLLQNWLLDRLSLWGAHPFIVPFLAVLPATVQRSRGSLLFAFVFGLFCDIAAPAFLPCFYCFIFPALAFLSGLLSRRVIMPGFVCSFIVCCASLACIDLCHTLYLLYRDSTTLLSALRLSGAELAVSAMCLPVVYLAYHRLHRFVAAS